MNLQHIPINPPRAGYHGEAVYAAHWIELMSKSASALHRLLFNFPWEPGQREATVAATFVCWLGTNMGQSFLNEGKRLSGHFFLGDSYLAAWACHNRRSRGVNSSWRSLEHMMNVGGRDACIPDLSAHDYEAVEHIAHWLGSQDGQAFIAGCQAEIERRRKLDQLAEYHRRGMSDLPIVRQLESELAAG